MSQDVSRAERFGGPYMIQDRDHTSAIGQMGGEARQGRQSEQSQSDSRQPGSRNDDRSRQRGGERGYQRRKFL